MTVPNSQVQTLLFVSDITNSESGEFYKRARQDIISLCSQRGYKVKEAASFEDGTMHVKSYPNFGSILLVLEGPQARIQQNQPEQFLSLIRSVDRFVPIFLLCDNVKVSDFSLNVRRNVQEFVKLSLETTEFIVNRIEFQVNKYRKKLLPPFFRKLKDFALQAPYYWDCPGHMGSVAYLKHPIGRNFQEFFGENLCRADVGVMASQLGDWLTHSGPPGESEKRAARIFGADHTFYVLGGSSASNQIVAQASIRQGEKVLIDRNCHKSLNHAMIQSGAKPSYLLPKLNRYGILGLIPQEEFERVEDNLACLIVTNSTYDGLCYKLDNIWNSIGEKKLKRLPRVHFDEAWYAHAKFSSLYDGYYAMSGDRDASERDLPVIYAVQSTHKMLPALSMSSMIHVRKSKDEENKVFQFDRFNESFMMHGTTSPFYPLLASIDVATSMMDAPGGPTLTREAILDAIHFRKAVVKTGRDYYQARDDDWFFKCFQPDNIPGPNNSSIPFDRAEDDLLMKKESWILKEGEDWHGFGDDVRDDYYLLDPVKVTLLTPGIDQSGEFEDLGIPAKVVGKYLSSEKVHVAKTADYTLLLLFSVGDNPGKWGTLLERLIQFKEMHDCEEDISIAIPTLAQSYPNIYGVEADAGPKNEKDFKTEINRLLDSEDETTDPEYQFKSLKTLCQAMHWALKILDLPSAAKDAITSIPDETVSPSQAYQEMIEPDGTNRMDVNSEISGKTSAVMVVPYPPGIPIIMPGEKFQKKHIEFLKKLHLFGKLFPGFGSVPHGLKDSPKCFTVRVLTEKSGEDGNGKTVPGQLSSLQ